MTYNRDRETDRKSESVSLCVRMCVRIIYRTHIVCTVKSCQSVVNLLIFEHLLICNSLFTFTHFKLQSIFVIGSNNFNICGVQVAVTASRNNNNMIIEINFTFIFYHLQNLILKITRKIFGAKVLLKYRKWRGVEAWNAHLWINRCICLLIYIVAGVLHMHSLMLVFRIFHIDLLTIDFLLCCCNA